jgi:hypothetical protein
MSRWSHEHPERDYSNGSYFGRDAGTRERATLCAACQAPADRILCPSCWEQVRDGAAEREG